MRKNDSTKLYDGDCGFLPRATDMKVVVQNGARHVLTRAEAEAVVRVLPATLSAGVPKICLYQDSNHDVHCVYYEKERVLGIYAPRGQDIKVQKETAVDELLVALALISTYGYLPEKVSEAKRQEKLTAFDALRSQCMKVIGEASGV